MYTRNLMYACACVCAGMMGVGGGGTPPTRVSCGDDYSHTYFLLKSDQLFPTAFIKTFAKNYFFSKKGEWLKACREIRLRSKKTDKE